MTNQQLKAHCEDVIANPQDHLDWVVNMARVALASLEAEPVAWHIYQWRESPKGWGWYLCKAFASSPKSCDGWKSTPIYTAPPMPELKPIELPKPELSSAKGVLLYADDVISAINAAGYECEVKS